MNQLRVLAHLYSQPLMIEQYAWDAFNHHAGDIGIPNESRARMCSSCDPAEAPARYFNVLELMRLAGDVSQSFNGESSALPNDTAIITFRDVIVKHADEFECKYLGLTDLDDIDAALAHVEADANIRNVLLRFINSPGGSSIGVPETAARVEALARIKNVKTFNDSQCCSAGVYIGSQSNEFFVTPSAFTGSIGVVKPPILDFSKNLAMNGITPTIIKSGKFKDTGTQLRPPTQEEIDMLQRQSDRMMKMFRTAVKNGRPRMTVDAMEGQVFVGSEAVEVGLADAVVADLNEALAQF